MLDWPVEAACVIGLCAVAAHGGPGQATVGQVDEFLARWCFEVDQRLGEPAACRWFLNFWDDTPRQEVLRQLLPEVWRELAARRQERRTS